MTSINFKDILAAVVRRLREVLGDRVHGVFDAEDVLAFAHRETARFPEVYVSLYDWKPLSGQGLSAQLQTDWVVCLAARTAINDDPSGDVNGESAQIMQMIIEGLLGFTPLNGVRALSVASPPKGSVEAGVRYIPILFSAVHVVHGHN